MSMSSEKAMTPEERDFLLHHMEVNISNHMEELDARIELWKKQPKVDWSKAFKPASANRPHSDT